MLDSVYHMTLKLLLDSKTTTFLHENTKVLVSIQNLITALKT